MTKERRIIEIRLEYPLTCAMGNDEVDKLLELYKIILGRFTCPDYDEEIRTWTEKVND